MKACLREYSINLMILAIDNFLDLDNSHFL